MAMKFNKGVTGIPVLNGGYSIEIGYVILPAGVERDDFIDTCDKNLRVSVMIDRNNAVIHNCLVTEQVYQYLKIPESENELGTPIILVKPEYGEKPLVIATIPSTNSGVTFKEGNYRKIFQDDNGSFLIQASLNDQTLLVNVDGIGPRKLKVVVNGDEGSGIELNTNGDKMEVVNGNVSVKSFKQIEATVMDVENEKTTTVLLTPTSTKVTSSTDINIEVVDPESGDMSKIFIDKENITLDPILKMKVKGGGEPIPLGDTLKGILEKINSNIDTLKQAWSTGSAAVTPAAQGSPSGGGGTAFTAGVNAVAGVQAPDLSKLNSEISFTD